MNMPLLDHRSSKTEGCFAGYTLTGTTCTKCAMNTYKDSVDNGTCTACTEGKTTNGTTGARKATQCGKCNCHIVFKWLLCNTHLH